MAIVKKGQEIGVAVHHSVYKPAANLAELKTQAALFNTWHKSKSWAEATRTPSAYPYISYHWLMATNGDMLNVTDGRYVKYHSGDNFRGKDSFNLHGTAVCLTGNYENDKPTPEMEEALVLFIRGIEKKYDINARVRGHKETASPSAPTACPGRNIGTSSSGWLKGVIAKVNDKNYPPEQSECEKQLTALKAENLSLGKKLEACKSDLKLCGDRNSKLESDIKIISDENAYLEKNLAVVSAKAAQYEKSYTECVTELNDSGSSKELIAELIRKFGEWLSKLFKKDDGK